MCRPPRRDGAAPSTPTVAHVHRHCQSGTPLGLPIATARCMKMDANSWTAHHRLTVACARCLRDRTSCNSSQSIWLMQTINPHTQWYVLGAVGIALLHEAA